MARYYFEKLHGVIHKVVAQDETGVYSCNTAGAWIQQDSPDTVWVKLEEWPDARLVRTTSWEYLEFSRLWERSSYWETRPTKIYEEEGNAKEVALRALARGS